MTATLATLAALDARSWYMARGKRRRSLGWRPSGRVYAAEWREGATVEQGEAVVAGLLGEAGEMYGRVA